MAVTQTIETGPTRAPRVGGIDGLVEFEQDARIGATQAVSWISDPCTFPQPTTGLCWEQTPPEKQGEGIGIETSIGDPFVMYGGVECWLGEDQDFDTRARLILEQGGGRFIEQRVVDWATDGAPMSAVNLTEAVAEMDNALDAEYLGQGIIWVNRGDAVRLDTFITYRDGRAYTVNGTPIVSSSAVPAGTVFATGAIKVVHGEIREISAVKHQTNREMSIAERAQVILVDCSFRTHAQISING